MTTAYPFRRFLPRRGVAPIETLLRRHLLRHLLLLAGLLLWTACRDQAGNPTANNGTSVVSTTQVKIEVDSTGLYRLSLDDLRRAGLEITTLATDTLALTQGETAVPYFLTNDTLIFYGQAPTSRYTATRPYILQTGQPGTLMSEGPGDTPDTTAPPNQILQTIHLEENLLYTAQARQDENSDVWFWQEIGPQQTVDIPLNLPTLSDGPATLRLHLWGISENVAIADDHDLDVLVNRQLAETIRWDGANTFTATLSLPAGLLQTGNNTITLDNQPEGVSFLDISQLNWLELVYPAPATAVNDRLDLTGLNGRIQLTGFSNPPQLFDITNPAAPVHLTGTECNTAQACLTLSDTMQVTAVGPAGYRKPTVITPLRQSTWRNSQNQADLLIITTDELAPGLAPLVAARETQGLSANIIPVAEIYDTFGYGEASPDSIRAFLSYATTNWQPPAPRYLLLVGDATTDYHNYLGHAPTNIIPSPLVPVQYSGETVSDTRLADIDNDMKPDLAVGRWPVDSRKDVESLVRRTLAYEQGTAVTHALFTTDASEPQFVAIAQRLYDNSGLPAAQLTLLDGPQAADVITQWNEGAWLVAYIGHGSVRRWGQDDVMNLEAINDFDLTSPSITIQLTCLTGLFAHPDEASLTEEMMRQENGPVLHVAATSLTLSTDQELFAQALLQNLHDPAYSRIGDAFQAAKLTLSLDNVGLREISDTFNLFGDPSATIIRP